MAIAQVDLVGNSKPVVTPSATAAMSEAVRNGTISILDIMDRVDHRTRAKQELELVTAQQGIAEATDPQLIEAKRNQQLAAGATAQSTIANAPLAQKAKEWELKAAIFDAQSKPGGYDLMQAALSKAGFPVAVDPNQGLTDANQAEILKRFSALSEYAQEKTQAEDRVANTKSRFEDTVETTAAGTTKKTLQRLFHNEQEVTGDQLKIWAQKNQALKQTPFSSWYSLRSGQASQPAPPEAQPAAPLIQPAPTASEAYQAVQALNPASDAMRAQLFNAATASASAPIIQPTLAAAPVQNIVQPAPIVGQIAGQTMVTGFTPAPVPVPKPPTETQGRSGSFAGRMDAAELQLKAVLDTGFDPTTASAAAQQTDVWPEGFKQDAVKRIETAKKQWVTALLRRESGAAVPKWELDIYDKAFFPQWDDPPDLVASKTATRQQAAQSLRQEAQGMPTYVEPINPSISTPAGATGKTTVMNGKTYKVQTDSAGRRRYFLVQ